MPLDVSRLDAEGREVLSTKPVDVRIGRRPLTDHERFMRVLNASRFMEEYNARRMMEDDDDFEFEDSDEGAPPPVPQRFESLEEVRQPARRQRILGNLRFSKKGTDSEAVNEPPLPLEGGKSAPTEGEPPK